MGNTTSPAQAQQRIEQIQMQLRNEYSALNTELNQMVTNIKRVGYNSRIPVIAIGLILYLILGSFLFAAVNWFLGLVIIGAGILITYYSNKSNVTDNTAIDDAISTLENLLAQNWPNK